MGLLYFGPRGASVDSKQVPRFVPYIPLFFGSTRPVLLGLRLFPLLRFPSQGLVPGQRAADLRSGGLRYDLEKGHLLILNKFPGSFLRFRAFRIVLVLAQGDRIVASSPEGAAAEQSPKA